MAEPMEPQKSTPEGRDAKGRIMPGTTLNPGGRPKKLVEIERMLDAEHRNPENMRKVFRRLKNLATKDRVRTFIDKKGEAHTSVTPPDAAFMKLYLERVLGPVKDLEPDLSDAPDAVLRWYAERN